MSSEDSSNYYLMFHNNIESSIAVEVKSKQHLDKSLMEINESVLGKLNEALSLVGDGILRYRGGLCVPKVMI